MLLPPPREGASVVVLTGGGLSIASEIPGAHDEDGLWEGHTPEAIARLDTWWRDRELVRRYYDQRRINCVHVLPNAAHEALARLQHRWGARRVVLITHAIDDLLKKAGADDVWDMYGSLWHLECEEDDTHPHLQLAGKQSRDRKCSVCGAMLRPDVVWQGEKARHLDKIEAALDHCALFVAIGTDGRRLPEASFVHRAKAAGARTVEINPRPTRDGFDEVHEGSAEEIVPALVGAWLAETVR